MLNNLPNLFNHAAPNRVPANVAQPGSSPIYRGGNLLGATTLHGPDRATVRGYYNEPGTTKISLHELGGKDNRDLIDTILKKNPDFAGQIHRDNDLPRVVEENQFYPYPANNKTETLLIHGTFSPESVVKGWTNPDSQLSNGIRNAFDGPIASVQWSGKNNRTARLEAAEVVAARITANHANGITTNIVAHSHGGNVAFEALKISEHRINQLITLATPIRRDHVLSREQVIAKTQSYTHIYGQFDGVARFAGGTDFVGPFGLIPFPGLTSRKNPNADKQFEITGIMGPLSSHSSGYQHRVLDTLLINDPQRR